MNAILLNQLIFLVWAIKKNEINEIKDYFNSEIEERKIVSKKSKYIAALIWVSIISFASVIVVPAGIGSASFTLVCSLATGIIQKVLKITGNKKHDKILILAKSKLNSIETLISQALIDLDINHGEFKTIVKEKEKYEKMKGSIRMIKSSDELGESNRSIREKRNA